MCDELLPDGQFLGWADRVARALAAEQEPGFRYANLAVRGKLIGQIHDEQLEAALAMGPELVTLAGGLNDVLRPGCDVAQVEDLLGRPAPFDWRAPLAAAAPRGRSAKLRSDLRWLRIHLGPWIGRRLTGKSSGDGRMPKRAELLPYEG
jgi:lysophospholipase L1-like esterase